MKWIFIYLVSIVAANLSITYFGPQMAILNAFLFIALDFTARDKLHDRWQHQHVIPKMALLIAAGSILSYLLNKDAKTIALASFIAFAAAGAIDTIIYTIFRNKRWMVRSNSSNIASSIVDSLLFGRIAFGVFLPTIIIGQILAKIIGGLFWSYIIGRRR